LDDTYATLMSCSLGRCNVSREDQSVHQCINGVRLRYTVESCRSTKRKPTTSRFLPAELRIMMAVSLTNFHVKTSGGVVDTGNR
jgi:hypothetical protein